MKTQSILTTFLSLLLCSAMLTACDRDESAAVRFEVNVPQATVKAGEAVNFEFTGNPDYLVFYPGTKECSYANRERTQIELDSLGISCTIDQVYTDLVSYAGESNTVLRAFISKDYSGENTPQALQKATWTEISGTADGKLHTPVATTNPTVSVPYTETNISSYLKEPFCIGFRYKAAPNTNPKSKYGKPRVQVKQLTLAKRDPEKNVVYMSDAVNEWGFSILRVQVAKENNTRYTVEKNQLTFFPDAATEKDRDVEVWMVSKKIDPRSVQPDRGMPIKSTNAKLPSYKYVYDRPGTYTATFVATNANAWTSERVVREVTVRVEANNQAQP